MTNPHKRQNRPKRSIAQAISWWWQTRIKSWWSVRFPAMQQKRNAGRATISFQETPKALPISYSDSKTDTGSAEYNRRTRSDHSITAILTLYKRAEYLPAQIEALRMQSVPPAEIWVWCNSSDELIPDVSQLADRVIVSNSNWKFWGRFSIASLARTRYVALFDDDVLPQKDWLENCLATFASGIDGILGGSGVVLPESGGYSSKNKVGWNGHHHGEATPVDLVGHAWFVKKEHFKYMWFEEPLSWENGEDIHFSYMALKHGALATWVPPHPESEPALWSCRPDFGKAVGRTNSATFKSVGHHQVRDEIVMAYRQDGWKVVSQREGLNKDVTSG